MNVALINGFVINVSVGKHLLPSYRNQSIDLQNKSVDWFLCGSNYGV